VIVQSAETGLSASKLEAGLPFRDDVEISEPPAMRKNLPAAEAGIT